VACLSARLPMAQLESLEHLARNVALLLNFFRILNGMALCSSGHMLGVRSQRQREKRAISA
jgi:hypothetical protein